MAETRGGISASAFMGSRVPEQEAQTNRILASNQSSLDVVNVQLVRISTQMGEFSNSLTRITGLLNQSFALERIKEQQQERQERILAEQRLREGQESLVERKMQSALAQPVQKIGAKTQGTLSNLMRFFTFLLGGWLSFSAIKLLKSFSEGNKERLQEISKTALKGLGIIGGIFAAIRLSLNSTIGSITRAGSYITQAIYTGLFKRPVEFLRDLVQRGIGTLTGKGNPSSNPPTSDNTNAKTTGAFGTFLGGALQTITNFATGKTLQESLAGGSAVAGYGGLLNALPVGGLPGAALKIGAFFLGAPKVNEAGINIFNQASSFFTQAGNTTNNLGMNFNVDVNGLNPFSTSDNQENHRTDIIATSPAQVSSPPRSDVSSQVGPEPGQRTQVVLTDATAGAQQESVPAATGSVADLPFISSSNPDNFYVLYSQVHYNVVI
jgi:hypothetical protein